MAKFWFVSAPLFSHLDWGGYLATAQALLRRGHDVTWVSETPVGGALAKAGVPFVPIRKTGWLWPPPPVPDLTTLPPQEAVMLRYRRALDTWLSEDLVGEAIAALIELAGEIGRPDVIVTDPFLTAAALAAEAIGVPLAVCGWPAQKELNEDFLFPVQKNLGSDSQGRIERLCERFGLQGVNIAPGPTPSILSPHLHVTYFSPSWYAADADNILPQTLFVGGKPTPPDDAPPEWLSAIPENTPLALVTLGTTFTGDLGFFSWAAQAAARVGFVPIVVIGWNPIAPEDKAKLIAALPKNTRLINFVPFAHVLPRTQLMIHHGGMGTTHAALIYGLPQIVVPHAADQRGQARRVAQALVGLNLSAHDVKHGMLYEGVKAPRLWGDGNAEGVRRRAAEEIANTARAAQKFGVKVVNGFTGSPVWHLIYRFPPTTDEMVDAGYREFADRWNPILDVFDQVGVRFALEAHPSEIAYDIYTAEKTLAALNNRKAFGFNFDPSHFIHQQFNPVEFIERFPDRIYHVHVKDSKLNLNGRNSILGSHLNFGDSRRGWNFVSVGRGDVDLESIIRILNRIGYEGPLSVEWEDIGMDREHGAREAVDFIRRTDFAPSNVAFDAAFASKE